MDLRREMGQGPSGGRLVMGMSKQWKHRKCDVKRIDRCMFLGEFEVGAGDLKSGLYCQYPCKLLH